MRRNKGISLIVLVITIIVMIILAGSIILSLSNNGIIGKANEAVDVTNLKQVQTLAELKWTEAYLNENVKNTTAGLREAVKGALVEELGEQVLVDYKIKVTAKGVTVEVNENTEIISTDEIEGANKQFKYVMLANGDIQITRYIGEATEVTIPSKYDGYDVYAIGNVDAEENAENRFNIFGADDDPKVNSTSNTRIKNVTISEGIREIKIAAFRGSSGLNGTLTLPQSLEVIDDRAFEECVGLSNDLIIPDGVVLIGKGAFSNCNNFDGYLKLPDTLETIGAGAFYKCSKLQGDIIIPEGITVINAQTFRECSITSIELPSTLETIGDIAFYGCANLTGDLVIPKGVKVIGEFAFEGCTNLRGKLVLPEGVVTLGKQAFAYCTFTGELKLPSTLETIGKRAFGECPSFTGELIVPEKISKIEDGTFHSCKGFTSLLIPKSVKQIGVNAFYNCNGITTINYTGTEQEWENITISSNGNDVLQSATKNYNKVLN